MKRPMASQPPSEGFQTQREEGGESVFPLVKALEAYDPATDVRERFLTDDEEAAFVETFERTGFTGGINWYRNISRNWERSANLVDKVNAPSLMITAELDAVLPPSAADGMEAFVPDLEKAMIKGSGHWTQQEKPQDVDGAILGWLDRRFPK
jgi:pimeloyl-ACP methyl ester carboxylesterase